MSEFQVVYVPIGVPTFELVSAKKEFDDSIQLLQSITDRVVVPEEMLLSINLLNKFLDSVHPDLIILQNITFANAAYASEVVKRFTCPILLWTLREPVLGGGRLRLNSLTGAFSAANTIKAFRSEPLEYIYGSPKEENIIHMVKAMISAAELKYAMKHMKLAAVGHTPQGFGFGRALDLELLQYFGVTLESIEARELIDKAKAYTEDDISEYLSDAEHRMIGLSNTPKQNRNDFARLYKAYRDYVMTNNIQALASRCWPDFFTVFGTPVCAALAMMNDLGIAASCEADTYGALSMYLGMQLTNQPTFFGDPVSLDETENTITFWHCGTAACTLARDDTGAMVGVHCNRKIGPTLEFGCKPSKEVTIFRVGKKPDGSFRFFLAEGEALDKPKQFNGTSVVVKTKTNASNLINQSIKDGWEPHFVVIYGNTTTELELLAHMLNMEVYRF